MSHGGGFLLAHGFELQFAVPVHPANLVPQTDVAHEDFLTEGVFHHALNGPAQGTCAILQIVARGADKLQRVLVHGKANAPLGQTLFHAAHHQPGDLVDFRLLQGVEYDDLSHIIKIEKKHKEHIGKIAVCTAGTADIPVAEEAAQTAEYFGTHVERIFDVGVSGIHRLFSRLEVIQEANCVVAVAGMEGALASVLGGLVDKPVIAVPTSVGYGASMNGLSALLTMINSCANGIAVVNIDNGYGAGYIATQINRLAVRENQEQ